MNTNKAEQLLNKYNAGLASAEEIALVERWYLETEFPPVTPSAEELLEDQFQSRQLLKNHIQHKKSRKLWIRMTAAAAILLIIGSSIYNHYSFEFKYSDTSEPTTKNIQQDVDPGSNKAFLILADGKKLFLTDQTDNGKLAEQAGIKISKTNDGQLVYEATDLSTSATANAYNTIITPKGGQYQVLLPDGTKVWLNSASSLKYPVNFSSLRSRRVELQGEAYFEVAKDNTKPFFVNTDRQEVEVLGTHFNINSYADEATTATTLLEGSVKLTSGGQSLLLKPEQQAQLLPTGKISVSSIDTEQTVSWKDGVFTFTRADLKTAMRQIARWYDVEVEYVGDVPDLSVTGKIYRNITLQQTLQSIGYLDVHFTIKGRKVTIESTL
ncbi:FecR family protein [Pedobacter sp.]|uniref:FecR family protein n=1 Tax=Pedobacter sp. TaxID=1411316 RepID=UPI003D7F417B